MSEVKVRSRPKSFKTLVELLNESAAEFKDEPALGTKLPSGEWKWHSFRQFATLVDETRAGLASLGVGHGDKVAIISDNRVEWAALAFGAYGLGAVIVPMYQAQLPAEWEFILNDSGTKVVAGATKEIHAQLREIATRLTTIEHVIGLDLPESDDASFGALVQRGRAAPVAPHDVKPTDLAGLIYTSGTTGNPKGVCLTHWNFCSNVQGALDRFDFREGDRSLAFLPWAHAFGQTAELYSLLRAGAGIALNDAVPNLITNLPIVKPTVLVAVPRIFNRIYDGVNKQMLDKPAPIQKLFSSSVAIATKKSRGDVLSWFERLTLALGDKLVFSKVRAKFGGQLRFVVSGSAALSPAVGEFIDALGIDVFEGYGLTETSPVVSANYPGHRKIGTVGPPFPGITVTIDRSETKDPVQGEIIVSGDNVMQGYYKRPDETAEVIRADGSFRTGDMGYIDDEGFLRITGRIKEQYKLENGKYVVPSPLEEELKLSPFILNIMLFGMNRPHNVALVVVDLPAVERWAKENGVTFTDCTQSADVKKLILAELDKYSKDFKGYERPKDALLIVEDFTTENDMLTPKMSLKRRNVLAKYGAQLEALFR